jgi:hypothetical protein
VEHELEGKRVEIVSRMKKLRHRLEAGDNSELLAWILPGRLACAQRPLRHHPLYAGSGAVIPAQATPLVFEWAAAVRAAGIISVISFMHDRDLGCYAELNLDAQDLLQFFENQGFTVVRLPWEDPHHSKADARTKQKELEQCRVAALEGFDRVAKPVLLQCSAGIDRSAPVAAYIWQNRSAV